MEVSVKRERVGCISDETRFAVRCKLVTQRSLVITPITSIYCVVRNSHLLKISCK